MYVSRGDGNAEAWKEEDSGMLDAISNRLIEARGVGAGGWGLH